MKDGNNPVGIPSRQGGDACRTRNDKVLIVCDFDGTACSIDMGSRVLDRFAGDEWRAIDRAYSANEIGSRLAYTKVAPLFRGSRDEMVEFVRSNAFLDPYFGEFYRFCRQEGYDLKIASDGLDFYIKTVLEKHGLADIEYYSNTATFTGGAGLLIGFPYLSDRMR
jgi:2,3-diketo-5-methylthio-1-phosphopentane phosphatase